MDDNIRFMLDIASVRRKMQANMPPALLQMRRNGATISQLFEDRTHDIYHHLFPT